MLAKSIIAGTVLSLMAGGVVYFGTDIDTNAVKDKVVQKTADMKADISDKVIAAGDTSAAKKTETSTDMPSVKTDSGKIIEAKKPTVSHSSASEKKGIKTAEVVSPDAPQKKWLDQYLKTETPEKTAKKGFEEAVEEETVEIDIETAVEEKPEIAKELMESMGLTKKDSRASDTGSFIIKEDGEELTEEQILKAEAEGFEERALETENIWTEKDEPSETGRKTATRKMLHDIIKKDQAVFVGEDAEGEKKIDIKVISNDDGKTTIETETIDMGDGKIMKIVKKTVTSETQENDGKKMRIKVMTDEDTFSDMTSKDISSTVNIIMAQAEKIKLSELRDRAYLDLVSYGVKHGNYKVAAKALSKIEQVELRDTARNRIAVAYAKAGDAENAFDILEDIEVASLRDVMRLQVIEAMIAPDELTEDMQ